MGSIPILMEPLTSIMMNRTQYHASVGVKAKNT